MIAQLVRRNTAKRVGVLAVAAAFALASAGTASALPTLKVAAPGTVTGGFSVSGTKILDPRGQAFTPRGVNKGGLEWLKSGYDESFATYQKMAAWGANVVRVPLSPAFGQVGMCTYDSSYLKRVDRIVEWTRQLGMLVILDDHVSTKGLTCGIGRWAVQQKAPDVHSLDFVTTLAKRYKSDGWVAIDLYNEPHDISDSVWRNGGLVDGWRAVGMQQLLDAVRSAGNQNLVFASGNEWGNDLRMVVNSPLQNDKNVVYAAHTYPFLCYGRVVSYQEAYNCNNRQYPPFLDTQIAPALERRAVMITEFGTQRSIPGEVQAPIDWAEAHHIGWSAWLWGSGKMTDFCLLDSTGNPSISGRPVRDSLARASGR